MKHFYFNKFTLTSEDYNITFIDNNIFLLRRQDYPTNNTFTYSTYFTTIHSWIIIFYFYNSTLMDNHILFLGPSELVYTVL